MKPSNFVEDEKIVILGDDHYKSNKENLEKMCFEFVESLSLNNLLKEGGKITGESIEGIISKLDDLDDLLEEVNAATQNVSTRVLPKLVIASKTLEAVFQKIDVLEVSEIEKMERVKSFKKFLPKSWRKKKKPTVIEFNPNIYKVDSASFIEDITQIKHKSNEQKYNLNMATVPSPTTPKTPVPQNEVTKIINFDEEQKSINENLENELNVAKEDNKNPGENIESDEEETIVLDDDDDDDGQVVIVNDTDEESFVIMDDDEEDVVIVDGDDDE